MSGGDRQHQKAGERIARELEQQISANGWQEGHRIGREEDLTKLFKTGKATLREAIAIAEMDGFIESRSGQNGGLYVGLPVAAARLSILRNFLLFAGASASQLDNGRHLLEQIISEAVARRIGRDQADFIRECARIPDDHSPAHLAAHTSKLIVETFRLAEIPVAGFCLTALLHAKLDVAIWNGADVAAIGELSMKMAVLRRELVEAIIRYDIRGITSIQDQITEENIRWNARFEAPPADIETAMSRLTLFTRHFPLRDNHVRRIKKPEVVARLVATEITKGNYEPSGRVGCELGLTERFSISGGVFREASRMLERYGVVSIRRGNDGGLYRKPADPASLLPSIATHLSTHGPMPVRSRNYILYTIGCAALESMALAGRTELDPGEKPDRPEASLLSVYSAIADAADDPVLNVLLKIMSRQCAATRSTPEAAKPSDPSFSDGQSLLAASMRRGDTAMARRSLADLSKPLPSDLLG